MIHCPHCGTTIDVPAEARDNPPTLCSACGRPLAKAPTPWETASAPLREYFRCLYEIIFQPTRFFRKMPVSGGVSGPLAFALSTHWIGAALEFLWRSVVGGDIGQYFTHFFQIAGDVADVDHPGRSAMMMQFKDRLIHWFWGAGSVIADPFVTLVSILFTSALVFIGARILVTPGRQDGPPEITYESALRIICFGLTPAILAGLPLVGGVISTLWVIAVTVIAAREVYRISTGRAIVVALFPKILFVGTVLAGLAFFAVVLIKLIASAV